MAVVENGGTFKPNPETALEAIEQCVIANRLLSNENILDAYGHVSVRNPENPRTFFQSRSMTPENVTRIDILEIDLDGRVLSENPGRTYREVSMHAEIYRRSPDVNAICHNHAKELIPFSATGTPLRPMSQPAGMFYKGVPTYENPKPTSGLLTTDKQSCKELAEVLDGHRAAFIGVHGVVVVGENAITMITNSIALRDNAIVQLQSMLIGTPRYLTEEEGILSTEALLMEQDAERRWNYWMNRARKYFLDLNW